MQHNKRIDELVKRAAATLRQDPVKKERPKLNPHDFTVERANRTAIGLPEDMTPKEAIQVLALLEKRDSEEVSIYREFEAYPLDVAVQLMRAMELVFGDVFTKVVKTFFGDRPPTLITIPIGVNETIQVPFGRLEFPNTDGGYLDVNITMSGDMPALSVTGQFRRKYAEGVNAFLDIVDELVNTNSIYKGKSVVLNLDWTEEGGRFDPTGHAPKFRDVSGYDYDQIVLNKDARDVFERAIFPRLTQYDRLSEIGAKFRSGFLFAGPYGTGKTLASGIIANIANQNGITFLYVENPKYLPHALKIARMYEPAVIFVEDIERAAAHDVGESVGGRSPELDKILNHVDGIDTKSAQIMLVFTTNYPESIYPGLLRAGRIDFIINMERLDAQAIAGFLRKFGGNLLDIPNEELVSVAEVAADKKLIPAAIQGVIDSARTSALSRGSDKIQSEDIAFALRAAVIHADTEEKAIAAQQPKDQPQDVLSRWIAQLDTIPELQSHLEQLRQQVEDVRRNL